MERYFLLPPPFPKVVKFALISSARSFQYEWVHRHTFQRITQKWLHDLHCSLACHTEINFIGSRNYLLVFLLLLLRSHNKKSKIEVWTTTKNSLIRQKWFYENWSYHLCTDMKFWIKWHANLIYFTWKNSKTIFICFGNWITKWP